jgi:hypothetical protein
VGDRVGEGLQVLVGPLEFGGALLDAGLEPGGERADLILRGALRGEIGEDQGPQEHPVEVESADRQLDRNGRAARSGQVHVAA